MTKTFMNVRTGAFRFHDCMRTELDGGDPAYMVLGREEPSLLWSVASEEWE